MNRRELLQSFLGTIASYSLLETLFSRDAFSDAVKPIAHRWVKDLHESSLDLKQAKITPAAWQAKVKELYDRIELGDLLAAVDFDRLSAGFEYPALGVNTRIIELPRLDGIPRNVAFLSKVFGMRRDRAIIPHGHKNMVSCHYVLKGELRLRQYDKIEENDTHMVLEPTIDEIARVGSHSSISDDKNNVHWLRANTETAFTFDVLVLNLHDKDIDIENIDPYAAEKVSGGRLRVRKLGVDEALRKYGHDTHHDDVPRQNGPTRGS